MTKEDYNFLTSTMSKILELSKSNEKSKRFIVTNTTKLNQLEQKKGNLDSELITKLGYHTKEKFLFKLEDAEKNYHESLTELASKNEEVKQAASFRATVDWDAIALNTIMTCSVIVFLLSMFVWIPFDEVFGYESECSKSGGEYEGEIYDSVHECEGYEFGFNSYLVYQFYVIIIGLSFYGIMLQISKPKVRLYQSIKDEAKNMEYFKEKKKKKMENLRQKYVKIEGLEMSISNLKLEIKNLRDKIKLKEREIDSNIEEIHKLFASVSYLTPYYDKLNLE